jgi:hypothetical protein
MAFRLRSAAECPPHALTPLLPSPSPTPATSLQRYLEIERGMDPGGLRLAVAVAIVKSRREREHEAQRLRRQNAALLQLLGMQLDAPAGGRGETGGRLGAAAAAAAAGGGGGGAGEQCDDFGPCHSLSSSSLEQLLGQMLSHCPAAAAGVITIDELTQGASSCQERAPLFSVHGLELSEAARIAHAERHGQRPKHMASLADRASALHKLLSGIDAIQCAAASASAAGDPSPSLLAQRRPLSRLHSHQQPAEWGTLLDFMTGSLVNLPPSGLRQECMLHSIDALSAVLHTAGGRMEVASAAAWLQQTQQQQGDSASRSSSAPGAAPAASTATSPQPPARMGVRILAAAQSLLELACGGEQQQQQQDDSRSRACLLLLREMVQLSPLLGQLVLLACAARMHRCASELRSLLLPAPSALPAAASAQLRRSERRAGRLAQLAQAASLHGSVHVLEEMMVRDDSSPSPRPLALPPCAIFTSWRRCAITHRAVPPPSTHSSMLQEVCLERIPAWCREQEKPPAEPGPSALPGSPTVSYLRAASQLALSAFAALPGLQASLPLFCESTVSLVATLAASLQHVAVDAEFRTSGWRRECLQVCEMFKAAFQAPLAR